MNHSPKEDQEYSRRKIPDTEAQKIRTDLATCLATQALIEELDCIDPFNATKPKEE